MIGCFSGTGHQAKGNTELEDKIRQNPCVEVQFTMVALIFAIKNPPKTRVLCFLRENGKSELCGFIASLNTYDTFS
jgi:hypothetical protein